MPRQDIRIIKIPNNVEYNQVQSFGKMPRLYLQLLENTEKIIPSLINKEYIPEYDATNEIQLIKESPPSSPEILKKSPEPIEIFENIDGLQEKEKEIEIEIETEKEIEKDDDDDNPLENKLFELLKEDKNNVNPIESKHKPAHSPPTLAEIEKQTGNIGTPSNPHTLPNLTQSDEDDLKRELLFKFDLLKKSYKGATIPEFTIHSDYRTMQKTYEVTVRRLTLDTTVSQYKTYLIGGFMVVEFILGSWFKFDMQGFTQQQIISMGSYERLLIELGEKSYVPEGSSWPVEVRLVFLIIINAGFFIVSRMIMKKTGSNLMGMVNSFSSQRDPEEPKRKMKGPDVDLDNL